MNMDRISLGLLPDTVEGTAQKETNRCQSSTIFVPQVQLCLLPVSWCVGEAHSRKPPSTPAFSLFPWASALFSGLRSGKTEEKLSARVAGAVYVWVKSDPSPDALKPVSLLQPEEETQTVFDMEPSSTSSTPTSLVSFPSPWEHEEGRACRGA